MLAVNFSLEGSNKGTLVFHMFCVVRDLSPRKQAQAHFLKNAEYETQVHNYQVKETLVTSQSRAGLRFET